MQLQLLADMRTSPNFQINTYLCTMTLSCSLLMKQEHPTQTSLLLVVCNLCTIIYTTTCTLLFTLMKITDLYTSQLLTFSWSSIYVPTLSTLQAPVHPMSLQVFMATSMRMAIFWDAVVCSFVVSSLMMEKASITEI